MSRRNRSYETRAPLSFFDDAAQPELEAPTRPRVKRERPAVPGVVRPARVFKTKATTRPSAAIPGSKRHTREQIKHYKELMKKHFGNTRDILDAHTTWPQYATFEKIEDYINKVKTDYLNPIWEQKVNHKTKIEEIHSKHVDISGWDFESIHKRVSTFAEENGQTNRLTLEEPWAHDGAKPYANVVLAWLFAAKKQLMWTLTVYLKAKKSGDAEASKFIHDSEAGAAARAKFKVFKAKLHNNKRAPREPAFPDHKTLEEQYAALHPHHT